MALYYELPVYRDVYKLILMIFECTKDFSKEFKYTLGQDMKREVLLNVLKKVEDRFNSLPQTI